MILCAGEALIDMLPRKTDDGREAFAPHAGGAVFNTAIALGRLGVDTGFFSGISDDHFGDMLVNALNKSKVQSLSQRFARPTTLAFVTLHEGQAKYMFYDENTAGRMLTPQDLSELPSEVHTLFLGGISLVSEPCGQAYQALAEREAASKTIMIDPNIRPDFISDAPAYRARIKQMIALSDIVKLSDEDLHWLFGAGDIADLAKDVLAMGPKLVCITEGAKGAWGITDQFDVFVNAQAVKVTDTVGAGDTFNAGLLAALEQSGVLTKTKLAALDQSSLEAALGYGCKTAAVTVSRAGANPPWRHEL